MKRKSENCIQLTLTLKPAAASQARLDQQMNPESASSFPKPRTENLRSLEERKAGPLWRYPKEIAL